MKSLNEELLDMAALWKQTAQEMIQKTWSGSHSEMSNQMLNACADMVVWKIEHHGVDTRSDNERAEDVRRQMTTT
jgi:hypothetical protein